MAISFLCNQCSRKYRVEDHLAGRQVKCRQCGSSMTIPGTPPPGAPTASVTPPPPPVVAAPAVPPPPVWTPPSSGASSAGYASAPQTVWSPPASRGTVYRPPPVNAAPEKRRLGWKLWAPLGLVALGVLVLGGWMAVSVVRKLAGAAGKSGGIAAVKPADFPNRPAMREIEPGVMFCDIQHGDTSRTGLRLWLYLPSTAAGQARHANRSLPCVLVAPAGSTMMTGMELGDGDRDEHLPYVKAGFAVVAYELDGHAPGGVDWKRDREVVRAIKEFMAADGGVANGKAALEYVLAKVPEVDPNQVYTAGHSSAATLSLLMAIHEPRLKGAVAYAACYEIPKFHGADRLRKIDGAVSGVLDFVRRTSPVNLPPPKCPVFLFHAEDDSKVPASDARAYAQKLASPGRVTLSVVAEGDHYDSMIEEGIPQAIRWLKERGARPYAGAGQPAAVVGGAPRQPTAPPPRPTGPLPRPPGEIHPVPMPPAPPPLPPVPAPPRLQPPTNEPQGDELGALSPDPAMLEQLGDEETVNGYNIRLPKGWRGAGAGPTRIWRGPPGQGRIEQVYLSVRPARPGLNVRRGVASNPALLAGGDLGYCTINGREFARIVSEHAATGTVHYVAYDGQKEITIRLMYDPREPKSRELLEAAARTIR